MPFPFEFMSTPTMANEQYEKGKIKLSYTKNQIKRAGENIRKNENIEESIKIIRNFRAAHLYPLTIIKNLLWKHAQKIKPDPIIARRLKRLPTIIDKLTRKTLDGVNNNSISIVRMQDIGGCRIIFENKDLLLKFNQSLNNSRTVHKTKVINDYILNSKKTGYRGIHRIYHCYSNLQQHDWKGFLVEVQLRTKLQHLWATTVEIVDLCEGKALKTNPFSSDIEWVEFFQIMSDFLANDDGFLFLKSEQMKSMKTRLEFLNFRLKAIDKLLSFNTVFSNTNLIKDYNKNQYIVLAIDNFKKRIYCSSYSKKFDALAVYSKIEDEKEHIGLFVEIDDIKNLQNAYPNYLIDTRLFVEKFYQYTTTNYWVNPKNKISL